MWIPARAGMTKDLSVKKWYQMIKLDGFGISGIRE
jgi:hypothetical protein